MHISWYTAVDCRFLSVQCRSPSKHQALHDPSERLPPLYITKQCDWPDRFARHITNRLHHFGDECFQVTDDHWQPYSRQQIANTHEQNKQVPVDEKKNPSVSRRPTLTANRNPNRNPTNPMDFFPPINRSKHYMYNPTYRPFWAHE